ncbi:rhomboid family intramembrane serine protease [Mucilaginibacter conchicola]|uniref:Rhomboid family intramembrane serine protease n=1 Tax=Mucilaginibacter conchicola TaxID=2303333 RepID=A0A372NR64_9SPHI|nr:rhomboid family intramembrane serine protease [Mucilaginibacter conchicola]RFZ91097.1 rhomboid family intramembrane serine protease [Mucilaginibacter conchicola]
MKTYLTDPFSWEAPVSVMMLAVILLSSLYGLYNRRYFMKMILHPFGIVKNKEYYRLFTSDIIHNDYGHLMMNAIMYYLVCINLEEHLTERTQFGSIWFMLIYAGSYLTGVMLVTFRHRNDFDYSSAGASGSIMGCLMSFMILKPDYIGLYLPVIGGIRNIYLPLVFFVAMFIYQYRSKNKLMNNELHFYSAVGGIAATFVIFPEIII